MEKVKSMLDEILFAMLYFGSFVLQIVPSIAIVFLPATSVWLWVCCAIGLVALIVQAIKFPCFNTRIWRCGMVAMFIFSFFAKGWMV
jgi:hypothetical protein